MCNQPVEHLSVHHQSENKKNVRQSLRQNNLFMVAVRLFSVCLLKLCRIGNSKCISFHMAPYTIYLLAKDDTKLQIGKGLEYNFFSLKMKKFIPSF